MFSSKQKITLAISVAIIITGIIIFAQATNPTPVKIVYKDWDPKKPVAADNFKGKVPSGATASATLYWTLDTSWTFKRVLEDDACFDIPKFKVVAKMNLTKSWAKSSPSKELLNHEQRHLDIAEYQARLLENKLNKEFGKKIPCSADFTETEKKIDEMREQSRKDTQKMQDQYDKEVKTNGRIDPTKQKEWDKKIDDLLKKTKRS